MDSAVTHTISGPVSTIIHLLWGLLSYIYRQSNLPILNTMIEMPDASAPSSPTESTVSTVTSTSQSDPASPAQSSQSSEDLWVQLEDLSEYMNAVNLSEGEGT